MNKSGKPPMSSFLERASSVTLPSLAALLEAAPDAIVVVDPAGVIVLVNGQTEKTFGYRREELLGQQVEILVPECFRGRHLTHRAGYLLEPRMRPMGAALDLVARRKDGSEVPVEISLSPLQTEGGLFVITAIRDVTDRKRVERELEARIRQQVVVAELGCRALTGMDVYMLMDETTELVARILAVEYCKVLEVLPDGRTLLLKAGVGWKEGLVGRTTMQTQAGSPGRYVFLAREPVIIENLRTDPRFQGPSMLDDHGVVSGLSVLVYGRDQPFGVLGAYSARPRRFSGDDITFLQAIANVLSTAIDRKRLEQEQRERDLMRADQMVLLGQLAAGVAHEIRNPLTSIKGLIQVNREEAEVGRMPTEDLQVIEEEIRRLERTVQRFLDFARPPRLERRLLDLAPLVEVVLSLVGTRARKQCVAFTFACPQTPALVEVDPDQMQQLLLNLVLNALDAMPRGGTLEVALAPPRDDRVELRVCDTGPGISPHLLLRVFEPFFSTKETGLGLGLPVSRRVAEDHGGSLTASNRPESGACFVLRLPRADVVRKPDSQRPGGDCHADLAGH